MPARIAALLVGLLPFPSPATSPLERWEILHPLPFGFANDIAYGNGAYVITGGGASGQANWTFRSTDGRTWLARQRPGRVFQRIEFVDNQFVAFGPGVLATSVDGTVWITRTPSPDPGLRDLCHGQSLYVAVANGGRILTSTDLQTWHEEFVAPGTEFNAVTFGNGLFVAAGQSTATGLVLAPVARSTDGLHWTLGNTGFDGPLYTATTISDLEFADGQFIAAGEVSSSPSIGSILGSTNAVQWSLRAGGNASEHCRAVAHRTNGWVVVGDASWFSANGRTWKQTQPGSASFAQASAVAAGPGEFVKAGSTSSGLPIPVPTSAVSTNGSDWSAIVATNLAFLTWSNVVATAHGVSVAGFVESMSTPGRILPLTRSTNGTTWESIDLPYAGTASPATGETRGVVAGNDVFVAAYAGQLFRSSDGQAWTRTLDLRTNGIGGLAFDGRRFLAMSPATLASGQTASLLLSTDGAEWSEQPLAIPAPGRLLALGAGSGWIVLHAIEDGHTGFRVSRDDGQSWTRVTNQIPATAARFAFGPGAAVAIDATAGTPKLYATTNGIDWAAQALPGLVPRAVAFGTGRFVALAVNATNTGASLILESPDAGNWTVRTPADLPPLTALTVDTADDRLLAIGPYGHVARSDLLSVRLELGVAEPLGIELRVKASALARYQLESSASADTWESLEVPPLTGPTASRLPATAGHEFFRARVLDP